MACFGLENILTTNSAIIPDASVIGINTIKTSVAVLPAPSSEPANSGPAIVPKRPAATAAPTPVFRIDGW